MSGGSNIRNVGRMVLLGSIVGLGLGGCTIPIAGERLTLQQTSQRDQQFNEALLTRSPMLVTRFIQSYRRSPQSATLLNQMPARVLADIPRSAVVNLADDVKRRLSSRVRGQFGIVVVTGRPGGGGQSGGYGG